VQDTRGKDLAGLSAWTWRVTDDLSKGRIISCRTKPDPISGSTGRAIVRGSRGPRVEVRFRVFASGGISVTSAQAKNYFDRDLKWKSSDPHPQTHAISSELQHNLGAVMRKLKLEELIEMRPLKRWWFLKTN
jgi:hypothetical protein